MKQLIGVYCAHASSSDTHTEQRVDPDVAAFMPVPTRACADLALARTALNMIKQLKVCVNYACGVHVLSIQVSICESWHDGDGSHGFLL